MHHRIGGSGKEENLQLFDDCVGTFLATWRSIHWRNNRIWSTCATNIVHLIGSYWWCVERTDQQPTHHYTQETFEFAQRTDARYLYHKKVNRWRDGENMRRKWEWEKIAQFISSLSC